jgi:hypothetical protein
VQAEEVSDREVAASLSLGVGKIDNLFAGHRLLWSLSRRQLAQAREPTEWTAPWAGHLLMVERPRG